MRIQRRLVSRIFIVALLSLTIVPGVAATQPKATPGASPVASPVVEPDSASRADSDASRSGILPGPLPEGEIGVQWTVRGEGDAGIPVAAGELVLLRVGKTLSAYDVATGEPAWEFLSESALGDPFVWQDRVYIADTGVLFALDITSGEEVWQANLAFGLDANRAENAVPVQPAVMEGVIYVLSGPLAYAIDTDNGDYIWRYDLGGQTGVLPPIISASTMLFLTQSPDDEPGMLALSRETGQPLLQFTSRMSYTGFATVDDLVTAWGGGSIDTFFDYSGVITSSTMCRINGKPVFREGSLLGICDEGLIMLDPVNGSAQLLVPGMGGTPMGTVDNALLVLKSSQDRSISVLGLETLAPMAERWQMTLPPTIEGNLDAAATVTNGRVVLITRTGPQTENATPGFTLVAIGGTEGPFGRPLPLVANPPDPGTFIRLTTETSLLAAPSVEGAPIADLAGGDQVLITGQIEEVDGDVWWQIDDPRSGRTGWVMPGVFETEEGR